MVDDKAEIERQIAIDDPSCRYWKRHDGRLIPYPGYRTRAEWDVIARESETRAEGLPND